MPPARKVFVSSPTRCPDGMLAHCSPSSEWLPGCNNGEIKAARKGTGHPTPHADGSGQVSSLIGTPLLTKVYGTTLPFMSVQAHRDALQGPGKMQKWDSDDAIKNV